MDPAIIGAIGSVIGGLVGGGQNEWVTPDYAEIRRRAEEAGINPLTALAMAPGNAAFAQNFMGSAIADGALMLAQAASRKRDAGRLSQVQGENQRLRQQVQEMTLRPEVPGIYGARAVAPSLRQALGVSSGQASSPAPAAVGVRPPGGGVARGGVPVGVTADLPPLLDVSSVDPRRAVDNLPVTSDPGAIVIDNPHLGPPFPVPAVNGEVLDLGQALVTGGAFAYDRLKGRSVMDHVVGGMVAMDADSRNWLSDHFAMEPYSPPQPVYSGRGDYGMPRRRRTALGWVLQ